MATYGHLDSSPSPYHPYVQRRRPRHTCCGFSTSFILWILQLFNFILLISGVFLLLLTFFTEWSFFTFNDHFEIPTIRDLLPKSHSINLLHYSMISCGALIVAVSILNMVYQFIQLRRKKPKRVLREVHDIDELTLTMTSRFQSRREKEKKQQRYSSLAICAFIFALLFLFTFQLAIGFMSFLFSFSEAADESSMKTNFAKSLQENLSAENMSQVLIAKNRQIAVIQETYKCCGLTSFEDYESQVPDSCCKTISFNCSWSKHPSNINYRGCISKLANVTYEHIMRVGSFAVGLSFIHVFGLIFSCCLYVQLVRAKNY